MTLSKYIGKIDARIHNMDAHLDPDYTDNDEMVIHDTCGRVMPIPLEVCGEIADMLYAVERIKESVDALEQRFHRPTTSTF